MKDNPVLIKYSDDKIFRYEIYERENGIYEVWLQQKITSEYMDWFSYHDIKDYMHVTDGIERAIEIGDEGLLNLSK